MSSHLADTPAIEVVPVDGPFDPADAIGPERVSGDGSAAPAARTVPLWIALIAALTAFAAALAAVVWWLHRTETRLSFAQQAPVRAGEIDASGCPVSVECDTLTEATPGLDAAIVREFAGADLLEANSVVLSDGGKQVRATVTLRTQHGVVVTVSSQCDPHGVAVPRRRGPVAPVGPADGMLVVPGAAGCSVAVTSHTPTGVLVPIRAMEEVAYDPAVQLSP